MAADPARSLDMDELDVIAPGAFAAAVSQVTFGRLAPWLDLSAGAAVLSIGTLAIVLATATDSSALFLAGSVVTGAGWGSLSSAGYAR